MPAKYSNSASNSHIKKNNVPAINKYKINALKLEYKFYTELKQSHQNKQCPVPANLWFGASNSHQKKINVPGEKKSLICTAGKEWYNFEIGLGQMIQLLIDVIKI